MFEELIDKNVAVYLLSNSEETYIMKGRVIKSTEFITTIEIEERKKFGEIKKIRRTINNKYITFMDLI